MITLNRPNYSAYYYVNGKLPKEVVSTIDIATSDFPVGYDRTDKFQRGEWDGKFHLFNKSSSGYYYFPCGMIDDVTQILNSYDIEYVVKSDTYEYTSLNLKWNSNINLYPYQVDCLLSLMRNGSGVLSLPTGSGKTIVALNYAYARNSPFIVLVHRQELLDQWDYEIKRLLNIEPTLVGEGEGYPSGNCCVAMVQTLWQYVKSGKLKKISKFPLLILDEVHTIPSKTAYNVAMRCDSFWRVGLTATPKREDNTQLKIFATSGRVVRDLSVPDLISSGYIAEPEFTIVRPTSGSFKAGDSFSQVYRKAIIINEDRNNSIINYASKIAQSGKSVYIHVVQISHGRNIARKISDARFVCSNTKSRKQDIQDFKDGKYKVLVSTLLKEGVNIPSMDSIIFAAGYKSGVLAVQTIGRALRISENKKKATIVDFFDHGHRYIESHSQSRMNIYSETYGKYFKPKYIRSEDI